MPLPTEEGDYYCDDDDGGGDWDNDDGTKKKQKNFATVTIDYCDDCDRILLGCDVPICGFDYGVRRFRRF